MSRSAIAGEIGLSNYNRLRAGQKPAIRRVPAGHGAGVAHPYNRCTQESRNGMGRLEKIGREGFTDVPSGTIREEPPDIRPTAPLGKYPQLRLCGHFGMEPTSAIISTIVKISKSITSPATGGSTPIRKLCRVWVCSVAPTIHSCPYWLAEFAVVKFRSLCIANRGRNEENPTGNLCTSLRRGV